MQKPMCLALAVLAGCADIDSSPAPGDDHGVPYAHPSNRPRWPGNIVKFHLAGADATVTARAKAAMRYWTRYSNLKFVEASASDSVAIEADPDSCSSSLGHNAAGNYLALKLSCSEATIRRAFGKIIGLGFEHERADRDAYIAIAPGNAPFAPPGVFDIDISNEDPTDHAPSYASPYDTTSIMHFDSCAFASGTCGESSGWATWSIRTRPNNGFIPKTGLFSVGDNIVNARLYPEAGAHAPACATATRRSIAPGRRTDLAEVWEDVRAFGTITEHHSNGATSFAQADWTDSPLGEFPRPVYMDFLDSRPFFAGDFDGDGRQDLAYVKSVGGMVQIVVRRSTGAAFASAIWLTSSTDAWVANTSWLPGDFDGDGRVDVVAISLVNAQLTYRVFRNQGGASFAQGVVWRTETTFPNIKFVAGYFDSDARADVMAIYPSGGTTAFTTKRSLSSSTFASLAPVVSNHEWQLTTRYFAGNVNGDASLLDDVVAMRVVTNQAGASGLLVFTTAASDGRIATLAPAAWGQPLELDVSTKWTIGDFTGDGRADLASIARGTGTQSDVAVYRSTTSAQFQRTTWNTRIAAFQNEAAWCAGSFDND